MRKIATTAASALMAGALLAAAASPAMADPTSSASQASSASASSAAQAAKVADELKGFKLSFDPTVRVKQSKSMVLSDGTTVKLTAEPTGESGSTGGGISTQAAALNGTWTITGENGLARMTYKIVLGPKVQGSSFTTIKQTYGLAVTGRISSFSDEKINVVRQTETGSAPAIVEGYAKFNYLGNQWINVWTQSGGVRAYVRNGKVTQELY